MDEDRKFSKLTITPRQGGLQFRVRLQPPESDKRSAIAFDLNPTELMTLMAAFQQLQARYRIPIPSNLRPKGPPTLSVVTDEGEG